MKICIVSDSHDRADPLAQAVREAKALGAEAGDRFLNELGGLLNQEVRSPDFVARYGGDEFVLLMPSTGLPGARHLLGRIAFVRWINPARGERMMEQFRIISW